ncbi:site-specific integrase [Rheinheimera soli]|uniref:site-specific integrase n=1 Tax=Rheinheimera soli TaxID=443616 RepID=UPI001E3C1723|nr:site-specific integrase [Rheinheimera soli]
MRAHHSYLYQVKGSQSYYFRVRWTYFGRRANAQIGGGHFVASLGTADLDRALWLSRFILQRLSLFTAHYVQDSTQVNVVEALWQLSLKNAVKRVYASMLDEANQLLDSGFGSLTLPSGSVDAQEPRQHVSISQQELIMQQLQSLYALIEKSSAAAKFSELTTNPSREGQEKYSIASHNSPPSTQRKELGLEQLVQEFCSSKFREIGASAQQQYTKSLDTLVAVLGREFSVVALDHDQAQKVKHAVLCMSSGRKNADGSDAILSVKSVNKYLTNMLTFTDWLVKQRRLLSSNPFVGCLLKLESKHQLKRRPFELNEINAILNYKPRHKLEAAYFRDAAKWLPSISLFSGMRLDEIAGIRLRDVRFDEGIWFFDLSSYRLKTDNASRLIPIHSRLIDMGFIDFVDSQTGKGEQFLFPELQSEQALTKRDGPGTPVGKWFNRTLLDAIGIDKQEERANWWLVDFHSCRHTVASRFKFHGVPAYLAKQILGHELDGDITWGVYSGQVSTKLAALKAAIEALDY